MLASVCVHIKHAVRPFIWALCYPHCIVPAYILCMFCGFYGCERALSNKTLLPRAFSANTAILWTWASDDCSLVSSGSVGRAYCMYTSLVRGNYVSFDFRSRAAGSTLSGELCWCRCLVARCGDWLVVRAHINTIDSFLYVNMRFFSWFFCCCLARIQSAFHFGIVAAWHWCWFLSFSRYTTS